MTISILTALVIFESFIILSGFTIFLIRKNLKLKKAFDALLASMSENIFSKLVSEEIDKTNDRIFEIEPSNTDALELADTEENESEDSEESNLKKILTFRSAYLHAEINAYEDSDGDPKLFWPHLAENIAQLMPGQQPAEENEATSNEFIDEVMHDLQAKLESSIESNLSLQALLDSLLSEGKLEAEHLETIKNSQADFHDLSQHVSDLENKIQNSLNLEITGGSANNSTIITEKTLILEKSTNKVNTEVNKLKDIIYDQSNQINNLMKSMKSQGSDAGFSDAIQAQFDALERSQKETTMCMEVLEMENHRLLEDLEALQSSSEDADIDGIDDEDMSPDELRLKIKSLEKIIETKDSEFEQMMAEFESVQAEYMAVYEKGIEHD